jgi:hypothetical protein
MAIRKTMHHEETCTDWSDQSHYWDLITDKRPNNYHLKKQKRFNKRHMDRMNKLSRQSRLRKS